MSPPTGTYTFCALVCAPIPLGHRAEVAWLEKAASGRGRSAERFAHVSDLDTGISYGEMGCFDDAQAVRQGVKPLPLAVRPDLTVAERVRGRVLACQVATMGFSQKFIQTTLVLELSPPEVRAFR